MGNPSKRVKVIVSNVYTDDNLGSAALTEAALKFVNQAFPGAEVGIVPLPKHYGPPNYGLDLTVERHPEARVLDPIVTVGSGTLGGLIAVIRALVVVLSNGRIGGNDTTTEVLSANVVISRGGVVLFNRSTRGLLSLYLALAPLLLAQRVGTKTVLLGAHVGHIKHPLTRLLVGRMLRRADVVMPRGPLSESAALDLGVARDNLVPMPDSVFILDPPPLRSEDNHPEPYGVFTVSDDAIRLGAGNSWIELVSTVRQLLDLDGIDHMYVSVQVSGKDDSDVEIARRLASEVGSSNCTVRVSDPDLTDLLDFYSKAQFLVGLRLHSVVFALIAGTPSIALDRVHRKAMDLLAAMDGLTPVIQYDELSAAKIVDQVRKEMQNMASKRLAIRRKTTYLQKAIIDRAETLHALLVESSSSNTRTRTPEAANYRLGNQSLPWPRRNP